MHISETGFDFEYDRENKHDIPHLIGTQVFVENAFEAIEVKPPQDTATRFL